MVVKNSKSLTILIIVLSVLVMGLSGYLVYNEFFRENKVNEKNLIFFEDFDYKLNNNNHKITYKYYYEADNEKPNFDYYYRVYVNVYLDDKKIKEVSPTIYLGNENTKNFNEIKEILTNSQGNNKYSFPLNKDNLLILKGIDKEYLVLAIIESDYTIINPTLVNDNGKVLFQSNGNTNTEFTFQEESLNVPYFEGNYNRRFYIDGNKMYYLDYVCDTEKSDPGAYKYTITVNDDEANIAEEKLDESTIIGAGEKC